MLCFNSGGWLEGPARGCGEGKVHAEGAADVVLAPVLQHRVIEAGGKQQEQAGPRRHVDPGR